jgi:hypothetical protein
LLARKKSRGRHRL